MRGPFYEIIATKGQASKHGYIHNTFRSTKKKKNGIALGFLSIDLIQKEGADGKSIMEQYVIKWIFYPNSHALYHLDWYLQILKFLLILL